MRRNALWKNFPKKAFFLLVVSVFFLAVPSYLALSDREAPKAKLGRTEYVTPEMLLFTKAGRLFISRHYDKALEEFRSLTQKSPNEILFKRYIGTCLVHLKRDDEATVAFEEAIRLNANDLPSRLYLSKIYFRKGALNQAEEELNFVILHDKTKTFGVVAKFQLKAIQQLRQAAEKVKTIPGKQISHEDFLKTKGARFVMEANYPEALTEFESLAKQYPTDILIKRYQGIVLDKMGRFDEAVSIFQSILNLAPDNIATHYFLAQTLLHQKQLTRALTEFQYVLQNDKSDNYRMRADKQLKALRSSKPSKEASQG